MTIQSGTTVIAIIFMAVTNCKTCVNCDLVLLIKFRIQFVGVNPDRVNLP